MPIPIQGRGANRADFRPCWKDRLTPKLKERSMKMAPNKLQDRNHKIADHIPSALSAAVLKELSVATLDSITVSESKMIRKVMLAISRYGDGRSQASATSVYCPCIER